MSNVFRLPDTHEREWRVYAEQLQCALAKFGCANDPEIAYAMDKLKQAFMFANRNPLQVDGSPEQCLAALNAWVQTQVFALMMEIFRRDVELYRLRGPE